MPKRKSTQSTPSTATSAAQALTIERGQTYGPFPRHASITQTLKDVMKDTPRWPTLAPDQAESLEMIAHKIGRILNGDPDYVDSWDDIAGYAHLVSRRLKGEPI